MAYEVLEQKTTYQGKIVTIQEDRIRMPNGTEAVRETVIRKKNAAAVLPVLPDGKLLFVRQYRHAFGEMMLEVPAGVIEEGEDARSAIARELEEETGKKSEDIHFLCCMRPTVGFCSEQISLFFAFHLQEGKQHFDEDEWIELESYSYEQALELIESGEITDGKTIALIYAYGCRYK